MDILGVPAGEWFRYHPVMGEERRLAHEAINKAIEEASLVILDKVEDPECRKQAFFCLQFARMWANQGATFDEIKAATGPQGLDIGDPWSPRGGESR